MGHASLHSSLRVPADRIRRRGPVGRKVLYFVIIFIAATIIFDGVMKRTRLGKHIYDVGSNEVSARLSGINVDAVKTTVFVITGAMSGIAALL